MTCADFENLLTDYADGTLDRRVAAEVEQHRQKCPHCQLLFQEVARLVDDLQGFPEFEPPERLLVSILEKTSGIQQRHSFWQAIVAPTFRPFLTQRFAAATALMFVTLCMTVSLLGPGFSGINASDFRPSVMYKRADNFSHRLYRRMLEFNQWTKEARAELYMWRTDWAGRLDYHIITALFRNYNEIQGKQPEKKEKPGGTTEPGAPKQKEGPGKPSKKSLLPRGLATQYAVSEAQQNTRQCL
jgi:hypothetical protein